MAKSAHVVAPTSPRRLGQPARNGFLSKRRENGRNVTRFGQGLCGQRHGLAMNWVDLPRTSPDERDVVCLPRCRDCVWAVQGLVVFVIDLSLLREQST